MKILISSCMTGGRCNNSIVSQHPCGADFICYDGRNFPTRTKAMHPRLLGKIPKMLSWELNPGYDVYIWIDGPFSMKKPDSVKWYLDMLGDKEAAFFKHPNRSTVREEVDFCLSQMKKGDRYLLDRYENEDMENQVNTYLKDKNYIDDKLFACTSFVYSARLVKDKEYNILKEWFHHNCIWSVQDQLSLPYLLQKFNVQYNTINDDVYRKLQSI